jgi:hypothetical protein
MRLFEAIVDANHRALAGDSRAGLRPSEYGDCLPLVALTCIDARLNPIFPEVLGIREEDFIWLRNAGNILFDSTSSMMRTMALACAIKGGKEIAIIGHTDCRVRQVSVSQLIESFRALGIDRARLPDNLVEFFGLFASERQNVINGVNHCSWRLSPGVWNGWLMAMKSWARPLPQLPLSSKSWSGQRKSRSKLVGWQAAKRSCPRLKSANGRSTRNAGSLIFKSSRTRSKSTCTRNPPKRLPLTRRRQTSRLNCHFLPGVGRSLASDISAWSVNHTLAIGTRSYEI